MARGGTNNSRLVAIIPTEHEERLIKLRLALGKDMTEDQRQALEAVAASMSDLLEELQTLTGNAPSFALNPSSEYNKKTLARIAANRVIGSIPEHLGTPCWECTRPKQQGGYTRTSYQFADKRAAMATHRLMYLLTHGALIEGSVIRHHCDNPACHNPAHLIEGTHAENAADKIERGRGNNLLDASTHERFVADAASGVSRADLAQKYGFTATQVSGLLTNARRAGLIPAGHGPGSVKLTPEQELDVLHMYEAGASIYEIGAYYEIGASTVRRKLLAAGAKLRPRQVPKRYNKQR